MATRKMKLLSIGLLLSLFTLLQAKPVFAQLVPTPLTSASQSATTTPQNDADATITTIKNFVTSTDTLLGGFIFYTPDVFANSIELKDGTVLPGLASYRDIFYTISIPVIAIAITYFALRRLQDETPFAYKTLLTKLFFVAVLFIITPTMLSYSIQANNLLVQKITADQKFSQFITDFLDNEQEQIRNGVDPQEFGIPNTQPTFFGGIIQSFWQFILQSALFLIALFFFLIGFLFIAFQFIIRFATLLFLSVLFPIAIPFALSEKTEGITNNYFKTWFMFLIHQPAFALGYMLASSFLGAILAVNGASLGMLFFYSGFLFFLGGVNTLVSHVFGSSWTAVGANVGASMMAAPFGRSVDEFKRGAITGRVSGVRSFAGRELGKRVSLLKQKGMPDKKDAIHDSLAKLASGNEESKSSRYVSRKNLADFRQPSPESGTQEQNGRLRSASKENDTVRIQAKGYSAVDKKSGFTTTYLSKSDAQADGHNPSQLRQRNINGKYLDFSSSDKKSNSASKVKELLHADTRDMKKKGIKGVLVKKPGKQSQDKITRIYSQEPL